MSRSKIKPMTLISYDVEIPVSIEKKPNGKPNIMDITRSSIAELNVILLIHVQENSKSGRRKMESINVIEIEPTIEYNILFFLLTYLKDLGNIFILDLYFLVTILSFQQQIICAASTFHMLNF